MQKSGIILDKRIIFKQFPALNEDQLFNNTPLLIENIIGIKQWVRYYICPLIKNIDQLCRKIFLAIFFVSSIVFLNVKISNASAFNSPSLFGKIKDTGSISQKQAALQLLNEMDTSLASPFWPNVKPGKFYKNVTANLKNPDRLHQGGMTNFCGYAAFVNFMMLKDPVRYAHLILDLYRTGEACSNITHLKPSAAVRNAAGTLFGKGPLDINYADQILFLSLADHFKGYMNIFNMKYDDGDEDNLWASTTLAKFNRMMKHILNIKLYARGSDLLRPMFMSRYRYIKRKLPENDVILYVNSHFLNPSFKRFITLRVPTHYIHLYSIEKRKKGYIITYWDYGLKTQQAVTQKMFDKLIFGIICIKETRPL